MMEKSEKIFDKVITGENPSHNLDGMYTFDVPSVNPDEVDANIEKMRKYFEDGKL